MKVFILCMACLMFASPAFCEDVTVIRNDGTVDTYQVYQFGRQANIYKMGTDGTGVTRTTVYRDVYSPDYQETVPAASLIPLADD